MRQADEQRLAAEQKAEKDAQAGKG